MEQTNEVSGSNLWDKLHAYASLTNRDEEGGSNSDHFRISFIDFCVYLTFLTATTILTMLSRETNMFYLAQAVERLFVKRASYNVQGFELTFEDLVTVGDWWTFIEDPFVKGIAQLSNQNSTFGKYDEGFVFIGELRLRQIRVRNETCTIHGALRKQLRTCYGMYSKANEDVSGFFNKTHVTQDEINSCTISGKITSYFGGGYIETLSFEVNEIQEKTRYLKNSSWVDRATRAILIEFVLFNSDANLFCNVKLLAEVPPSGGVLTSSTIEPLGFFALPIGIIALGCAMFFYGIILFYTLILIIRIKCVGCYQFSCSVWNILDSVIVLIGVLSIAYVIWHALYMKKMFDNTKFNEQYFSLDVICYWNMFFAGMMGICVFLAWIKMFRYIKFQKTMLQFNRTFTKCGEELFGFTIMFMIVILAYADLSVLLFGTIHADFRDFSTSLLTMLRLILGDFNYTEIEQANKILAPMFFLTYILFVFFILINMFLAILNDTFSEVRSDITRGKENNFAAYLTSLMLKFKNHDCWLKKDEPSENEPAKPNNPLPKETGSSGSNRTPRHFLDEWFEIIPRAHTAEERKRIIQRIEILEQMLDKLSQNCDAIRQKTNI